jgi:hypothetical protein
LGGDINDVLEEVDSHIFKSLAFVNTEEPFYLKSTLINLLYYFYVRYTELQSPDGKYLYQELIIKLIEMFRHNLSTDFFREQSSFSVQNYQPPVMLYILSKICELNIYSHRITKIIEEFADRILSDVPVLHANRLYLLAGLLNIKPCLPGYQKEIGEHAGLLKERIDVEHIMNVECKNQDIYVKDGLSFVYILLFMIQKYYPEYAVEFNPRSLYNRIKNSDAWNTLINRDYYLYLRKGLYDGFPGANLVLMHIEKHFP